MLNLTAYQPVKSDKVKAFSLLIVISYWVCFYKIVGHKCVIPYHCLFLHLRAQ